MILLLSNGSKMVTCGYKMAARIADLKTKIYSFGKKTFSAK